MTGLAPTDYGDVWADFLDEWIAMTASVPAPAMLDRLAAMAGGGRVLELGVGTGFIALPLAGRGVRIEGVDASARMLELLAAKPGGAAVPTHLGDVAALDLDGPYDLVFFASSSLYCLPDADAQVSCFEGVARLLAPGGRFVVQTYVHDARWYTAGRLERIQAEGDGWVMRWLAHHDPAAQVVEVDRILERDGAPPRRFAHRERYCSPAELDLMARLAGLGRTERWGGWAGEPFTGRGDAVSVFERA